MHRTARVHFNSRRGAVLIAVLMGALIVATLALAALATARTAAQQSTAENQLSLARVNTISLLDWATAYINATSDWREKLDGVSVQSTFKFPGNMRGAFQVVDSDGRLNDDPQDPCDLVATLTAGGFSYTVRAHLVPAGEPLGCLQFSVCSSSDVSFGGMANITGGLYAKSLTVNSTLTAGFYYADKVEGTVLGVPIDVTELPSMPSDRIVEHYLGLATKISASTLPLAGSDRVMHNHVLAPGFNSMTGELNRLGIYAIDCGGAGVSVASCRFEGTIIFHNIGNRCEITGANHIAPAFTDSASLIVDGELVLSQGDQPLDETSEGINLNPPGAPYRGVEDTFSSTAYPSMIGGLVCCTGDLDLGGLVRRNWVRGKVMVRGEIDGSGAFLVEQAGASVQGSPAQEDTDPPLGFADYTRVRVLEGSVRRPAPYLSGSGR
ncbi:MAG: hypothetical protein Aurels2KO_29610 [Aureliella sp.]